MYMYRLCLLLLMWLFSPRSRWLKIQGSQFFSQLSALTHLNVLMWSLIDSISLYGICFTVLWQFNSSFSRLLLTDLQSQCSTLIIIIFLILTSFCWKNKRMNTDIYAVCWSVGAFSQIKFNLSLDVVLSLSKDTLVKHLPKLFISSMCSQLRKMGSVMEQFSKVYKTFFY